VQQAGLRRLIHQLVGRCHDGDSCGAAGRLRADKQAHALLAAQGGES
jgi:hypothetical protein